jgi:4'-phosphopantetheinyl transferase
VSRDDWRAGEEWTAPDEETIDLWRLLLHHHEEDIGLLDAEERQRMARLIVATKRAQRIAARAAVRRILARYLNVVPQALRFDYDEHGKPRLAPDQRLFFNLSHSSDLGLLAVSRSGRLGVDLELVDPDRPLLRIAARVFSPSERQLVADLNDADRARVFYRLWTLKEAYLKFWGTGFSFPAAGFSVGLGERPEVVVTTMPGDRPASVSLRELSIEPRYAAAVCWRGRSALRFFSSG